MSNAPVGVFDSGVGGLSVAHAISRQLPAENLCYIADQRFSPYGEKTVAFLLSRCNDITRFLIEQGCKAIVVACNTATVNCISHLRANFDIPIIGVEPGIKPAVNNSQSKKVAVLATHQTLASGSFQSLTAKFATDTTVEMQACPKFVSMVERGVVNGDEAILTADNYISPLLAKGVDQIVLGCTHFAFLLPVIEQVVAGRADIIDTSDAVARQLASELKRSNINRQHNDVRVIKGWSSETPDNHLIQALWGRELSFTQLSI